MRSDTPQRRFINIHTHRVCKISQNAYCSTCCMQCGHNAFVVHSVRFNARMKEKKKQKMQNLKTFVTVLCSILMPKFHIAFGWLAGRPQRRCTSIAAYARISVYSTSMWKESHDECVVVCLVKMHHSGLFFLVCRAFACRSRCRRTVLLHPVSKKKKHEKTETYEKSPCNIVLSE